MLRSFVVVKSRVWQCKTAGLRLEIAGHLVRFAPQGLAEVRLPEPRQGGTGETQRMDRGPAAAGFNPAKKTFWIVTASEPKMKKSYHSKAVPADEAAITRFIGQRCCSVAIPLSPEAEG